PEELRRGRGAGDPFAADLQFISKYALNILGDFKPDEEPIRPEAAALLRQRKATDGKDIPTSHCLPGGVPFSTLIAPFKMIQTPVEIVMLLEDNNPTRELDTDDRKRPANPEPMPKRDPEAPGEGDTTLDYRIGINEQSWPAEVG